MKADRPDRAETKPEIRFTQRRYDATTRRKDQKPKNEKIFVASLRRCVSIEFELDYLLLLTNTKKVNQPFPSHRVEPKIYLSQRHKGTEEVKTKSL